MSKLAYFSKREIDELSARLEAAESALRQIAKVTYGTEICNSEDENNAILAPWVFRYQDIARDYFAKQSTILPETEAKEPIQSNKVLQNEYHSKSEQRRMEAQDLDHPCKQTCSGWAQGYTRGLRDAAKESK